MIVRPVLMREAGGDTASPAVSLHTVALKIRVAMRTCDRVWQRTGLALADTGDPAPIAIYATLDHGLEDST